MKIVISRLSMQLDAGSLGNFLYIPPSYHQFYQPVLNPQADFGSMLDNQKMPLNELKMVFHDRMPSPLGDFGEPLLQTKSWDLWKSNLGFYRLFVKEDVPPRLAIVDDEFRRGDLYLELSDDNKTIYPLGQLEIRLFSVWLATFGDIILHASGIMKEGKGYCFLGEAGAGKSTLARVFKKDPGVTVLGEDTIILRYLDGKFWIFGTPWHLDPDFCSPASAPLEKMFFLDRSRPSGIYLASPADGISQILRTAVIPYYHKNWLSKIIENLVSLSGLVPFYNFSFLLGTNPWNQIKAA